jgi:hypothetical protein
MLTRKTYTPNIEGEAVHLFTDAMRGEHSRRSLTTPKRQSATPAEAFDPAPPGNQYSKRGGNTGFGRHSHLLYGRNFDDVRPL